MQAYASDPADFNATGSPGLPHAYLADEITHPIPPDAGWHYPLPGATPLDSPSCHSARAPTRPAALTGLMRSCGR